MIRILAQCVRTIAKAVRTPSDAILFVQMCSFVARFPTELGRASVQTFFRGVGTARRPKARSLEADYERVARVRNAVLGMPRLWRRNTCYVRALTLYRYLDGGERHVEVHFGVEQPASPGERLRGHAWVSIDGRPFEAPQDVLLSRVRELPLHLAV